MKPTSIGHLNSNSNHLSPPLHSLSSFDDYSRNGMIQTKNLMQPPETIVSFSYCRFIKYKIFQNFRPIFWTWSFQNYRLKVSRTVVPAAKMIYRKQKVSIMISRKIYRLNHVQRRRRQQQQQI